MTILIATQNKEIVTKLQGVKKFEESNKKHLHLFNLKKSLQQSYLTTYVVRATILTRSCIGSFLVSSTDCAPATHKPAFNFNSLLSL